MRRPRCSALAPATASATASALTLALATAACVATSGPGLRVDAPPHPAVAADVDWQAERFTGAGALPLFAQRWRPASGEPRAVLVIHHGLADHSDRYAGLAQQLARAGYAVWALDMRGHARSAGPRVVGDRIDDYLDDLDALLALVRAREPGRPVYLFGHSLGGLIASLYTVERGERADLAGLILSAPGIAFADPPLQAAVIRVVNRLAPGAPLLATPHGKFSASPAVVADMDHDPLIFQGNGPVRTAASAISGVHRVWAQVDRLRQPLLVLHGTVDQLTAPSGSRDLVARAAASDKTLRLYDGLEHDLLHEPDGGAERVAADIQAWLDVHTGAGGTAPPSSPAPARLKGDRPAQAVAVALDVRGERPLDDAAGLGTAVTAGLRLGASRGRATAAGLGWHGGLELRAGAEDGFRFDADLYPVGLAVRLGRSGELAVAGGAGLGRAAGDTRVRFPVEATLGLPLGPVRLLARAGASADLDDGGEVAGPFDQVHGLLAVRLGRDLRYWADVVAGSGPYLGVFARRVGEEDLAGLALGLDLWGAN